jgi:hypothetical protein
MFNIKTLFNPPYDKAFWEGTKRQVEKKIKISYDKKAR